MFNNTFYPTPPDVAKRMLGLASRKIEEYAAILDPSAGKGDLLEACICAVKADIMGDKDETAYAWRYDRAKYAEREMLKCLRAIEIEPDLRAILAEKEIPVIGTDFLDWTGRQRFDLILMNPPFDRGADHLLHAWELLVDGEIICLLNEETLLNPHSWEREKLQRLIDENGGIVEHWGACFSTAERPTAVRVACVKLEKHKDRGGFDFDFTNDQDYGVSLNPQEVFNQVAPGGKIDQLVATFNASLDAYEGYLRSFALLRQWMAPFEKADSKIDWEKLLPTPSSDLSSAPALYNMFLGRLNDLAWTSILEHPMFESLLTKRAREDFTAFKAQQKVLQFTTNNVKSMMNMLMAQRNETMEQCILDVFDRLCSYAPENKEHWEGWQTNDAYKVGMKVIVPWGIEYWKDFDKFHGTWRRQEELMDIDKAMCLISGYAFEEIGSIIRTIDWQSNLYNQRKSPRMECESTFFEIRFYKKGTIHLKFKDKSYWQEFNQRAAQGKKWLPAEKNPSRRKEQEGLFKTA